MNKNILLSVIFTLLIAKVHGHGLMVEPKARNAFCGLAEDQKPHNATHPACVAAFANDKNGGYQFMSVLTHDVGRQGVSPLPANVCGFNSETWDSYNNGSTTPWDLPLDWPTTPLASGELDIVWDISWGPHFDDTDEFVYYITKPDFVYQVGVPLTWNDFEASPFCAEKYNDKNPGANPNVVAEKNNARFTTTCQVPARSGRHVIYGEWGRNHFTFERFHGCMDVEFEGGNGNPSNIPPRAISQSLDVTENQTLQLTLAGTDSDGSVVSYVIVTQPAYGQLTGTGAGRTYTPDANYTGTDSFAFAVQDDDGATSSPATVSIAIKASDVDVPNKAPVAAFTYAANQLAVSFAGGMSNDPDNGPVSPLRYSWDFGDGSGSQDVGPVHTYAEDGTYQVSLTVSDGALNDTIVKSVTVTSNNGSTGKLACVYTVNDEWNNGFVAQVNLTNTSQHVLQGWELTWSYTDGSSVSNGWNSTISSSPEGVYTATNVSWNRTINPGQSVSFGFQGSHGGSTSVPKIHERIHGCDGDSSDPGQGDSNAPPTASFTATVNELSATFDAAGSDDPDNSPVSPLLFTWDFGDGNTGEGQAASHTYDQGGQYTVVLTVSDGADTTTTEQTVTVEAADINPPQPGSCSYQITDSWNSGFVAEITITNTTSRVVDGWQVSWSYSDSTRVTNGWNSSLNNSSEGSYTAGNLAWNRTIQPGASVTFGFQGTHTGTPGSAVVSGVVCN